MIGFTVILSLLIIILLYLFICWNHQLKQNRMCFLEKELDIINLGSTYAYYDFDYSDFPAKGRNLANVPQYLDYDLIILRKYAKYLKKNGKVLIVLPDFVFVARNTRTNRKVYYEALKPREIQGFCMKELLRYIFLAAKEPFTHQYEKQRRRWSGYVASYKEKEAHAEKRVQDWEGALGIPSVRSGEITDELKANITENLQKVYQIIDLCRQRELEPILVIPPVSEIMGRSVAEECLQKYLYEPIEETVTNTGIKLLDYIHDEELKDAELYLNSDCLNAKGVTIFMGKLYKDIYERAAE